jgi:hypothetical protein
MDLMMMERVGNRWEKMEGSCSTGQSPQWAVVQVEEEEEENCQYYLRTRSGICSYLKLGLVVCGKEKCVAASGGI